jgi:mRNA interferase RelE/StbE
LRRPGRGPALLWQKPLRHSKFGLWRYRLRDYRIICQLQDAKLIVLVVAIGHRSIIYDD